MAPSRHSRNVRIGTERGSLPVYGVVQDAGGQWHVIRRGRAAKPLDRRNPPPELLGRVAEVECARQRTGSAAASLGT
jgi:hypothetical protein